MWINSIDANSRGIKEKDLVRVFNDRGAILCYTHITERITPGVVWVAEGSWYKPSQPGNSDSVDAGADANTLSSRDGMSPHAYAERYNSIMAQVEKWTG